ncbi:hypothetical protein BD626DRAFT_219289 [Schizophyllum amplum]|uniref:Uncharacterized protein n=1 Tax=Schizophyllum amplum TaxID=97359 RepID=A0A550CKZ6_9AGAR|nr:hypothetical protein BD626DRAFT_219289 [Auriculariopsis ampla]
MRWARRTISAPWVEEAIPKSPGLVYFTDAARICSVSRWGALVGGRRGDACPSVAPAKREEVTREIASCCLLTQSAVRVNFLAYRAARRAHLGRYARVSRAPVKRKKYRERPGRTSKNPRKGNRGRRGTDHGQCRRSTSLLLLYCVSCSQGSCVSFSLWRCSAWAVLAYSFPRGTGRSNDRT